uniref:Secreted protein n=1 Tax=Heterorhabditis bacteriophora TaxID=37862 RepID=A0A1I7WZI6_HETBA
MYYVASQFHLLLVLSAFAKAICWGQELRPRLRDTQPDNGRQQMLVQWKERREAVEIRSRGSF